MSRAGMDTAGLAFWNPNPPI